MEKLIPFPVSVAVRVRSNSAAGAPVERLHRQGRFFSSCRPRSVLERQDHLEQGCAREVPLGTDRLDDPFERHILMLEGAHRHRAHPAQRLAKRRIAAQVGADGQCVHEEADEPLRLHPFAAGDRRAGTEVGPPGDSVQIGQERRHQHHEQRGVLAQGEAFECLRRRAGHRAACPYTAVPLHGRPGPVGRQIERWRQAGEPLAPPGELLLQGRTPQRLALPGREVGVLDGQLGQRGGEPLGERRVEGGHLLNEQAHGPAVGSDVVHGGQEDLVFRCEADEAHAQQRTAPQIERRPRLLGRDPPHLRLRIGQSREINHRHGDRPWGGDHLDRLLAGHGESHPQGLVAAGDLREGPAHDRRVERSADAHGARQVPGGAAGDELIEEPEPLLGEREGQGRAVPGQGHDRRACQIDPFPPGQQGEELPFLGIESSEGTGQVGHGEPVAPAKKRRVPRQTLAAERLGPTAEALGPAQRTEVLAPTAAPEQGVSRKIFMAERERRFQMVSSRW
jgi:hypothetical protein